MPSLTPPHRLRWTALVLVLVVVAAVGGAYARTTETRLRTDDGTVVADSHGPDARIDAESPAGRFGGRVPVRVQRSEIVAPVRRTLAWLGAIVTALLLAALVAVRWSRRTRQRREQDASRTRVERDRRVEWQRMARSVVSSEVNWHREATETALDAEARWRAVSGLTSDWVYCYRGDGTGSLALEWVTESFTRLTGFTLAELRSLGGLQGLTHPDDRGKLGHLAGWESSTPARELRIIVKDGSVRYVLDHGPLVWDDPQTGVARLYGAVQDITDRRRIEEALRRSQSELADFFDNGSVALHWVGPDERILRVNQAELDLLGYSRDEYVGRHSGEFYADREVSDDILRRLANNEAVHRQEARLRCADGSLKHVMIDANALWENGTFVRGRCFTWDMSDLKRIEEENRRYYLVVEEAARRAEEHVVELATQTKELEAARNAAFEAVRAKSEFLANMSHEIRTPMTAILGYTELLTTVVASDSESASHIDTVRRNGQHLLRIINDILDLTKIEAGRLTIEQIAFSPSALAGDVASLMRARASEKGLTFEVECHPSVPRAVRTDPTRLRQILINLLGNAIKFTQQGGVRLVVRASDSGRPGLSFEVIDTGIGIEPAVLTQLFTSFTQADASTSRRFGGTGLGLSISRRLAELLGGSLTARSTPGVGSVFSVTVAAEPAELPLDEPQPERSSGSATGAAPTLPKLTGRILLAEDTPDSQRLISHHLRKAGAEVEVADNGRIAYDAVLAARSSGTPFDVILMDIQMPEVDGYTATQRLREIGYTGPIVALTAYATASDRAKCLRVGCDGFLSKPIARRELIETVWHHMHDTVWREAGPPPAADDYIASTLDADPEMTELLKMFIAGLSARVTNIEASLADGDRDSLIVHAHQLKGTAGGYGFPSITEAAASLHASLKAGQGWDEIRTLAGRLCVLCRRARAPIPSAPNVPAARGAEGANGSEANA